MNAPRRFHTERLTGRRPGDGALPLYAALYAELGARQLMIDRQDWGRHGIGPWILSRDGTDIGIGGFRIGFGDDGLEFSMRFLSDTGQTDLIDEFITAALSYAEDVWNEDRFFARLAPGQSATSRIPENIGFSADGQAEGQTVLRLRR